ncbi:MAG: hypothetical protein ACMUHX_09695 [bacterium]
MIRKSTKNISMFVILMIFSLINIFITNSVCAWDLDIGQSNSLELTVNNTSSKFPLPGVTVNITSSPSWIQLSPASVNLGDIASSLSSPAKFSIDVSSDVCNESGTIRVNVISSSGDEAGKDISVSVGEGSDECKKCENNKLVDKTPQEIGKCNKCEDGKIVPKVICPSGQSLNPETCECEDENPKPPPGDPPDGPRDDPNIPVVRPRDPNEKKGPVGFSEERLVAGGQLLPYTIYFENVPDATAPAQQVRITDQLDSNLDWRTFRLREISFGNRLIVIPENRSLYQDRIDLGEEFGNLLLDISAGLNIITGEARWILTTIDPATGEQPEDPMLGFLPPNDPNHRGEGHVTFTIKSAKGLPTGTKIINRATIIFDINEPIETNEVSNSIDGQAPSSKIDTLPEEIDGNTVDLSWSGEDDEGGSGLEGYTIYVSDNNGPYEQFLSNTQDTSATFIGERGHHYRFYSLARDHAGNMEGAPDMPDASTYILMGNIDISGDVTYAGQQTGFIYAEAFTDANFAGLPVAQASIAAPGPYSISQVPGEAVYYMRAYRDSNGNGIYDSLEAYGICALNPIEPTDNVTGADIDLTDPDRDMDGLPDWWEQQIIDADQADGIQTVQDVLPAGDFDHDGLSNETEYGSGSDPCDSDTLLEKPAGTGHVRIEGGALLVDGSPYTIKGVIYTPTPVGYNPLFSDVYRPEHYERDLPYLRQMRCNTTVVCPDMGKTDFLDACWNNGNNPIRVIMCYRIDPGLDLSDDVVRQTIVDNFKVYIGSYHEHAAILMWHILGRSGIQYQGDPADWYTLLNAMSWAAYLVEGEDYHPVTTDCTELQEIGNADIFTDDAHLTGIDTWGIGIEPGKAIGDLFPGYSTQSRKPLWIYGFGIDAWDHNKGSEDEFTQALFNRDLWNEIIDHADVCLGGAVREYSDQWWLSEPDNPDQWGTHDEGPYENPNVPDGWIDVEYFGIMRLAPGEEGDPDSVAPRCSYHMLASHWRDENNPPEILSISPVAGEYRDPVMLASTIRDIDEDQIMSITYEYSLDTSATWILIGEYFMPDAPIEWYSGLNNDNVLIRASAYDGREWGEWYTTPYAILIDNLQPETVYDQEWQDECVTIRFTPTDTGSGFDMSGTTYYFVDCNTPEQGHQVDICATTGIYILHYYSIDDAGNQEETKSVYVCPDGWSMISLPLVPENAYVSSLFPDAVVLYGYKKGAGYIRVTNEQSLEAGKGYWIKLNTAKTYSITGEIIDKYNLTLQNGWYMIGGCTYVAQPSVDDGEIKVIYGFKRGVGYQRITAPERLEPGKGYWILIMDVTDEANLNMECVIE